MVQLRPHQERIVNKMVAHSKGQVIVPTGGGKTLCMIKDAQREFNSCSWDVLVKNPERKTIVIVAPRILLAHQHCADFEESIGVHPMLQWRVLHVHSGDTRHDSTTNPKEITKWDEIHYRYNKLIFTTYHSLHKIQKSGINVDTIYFDEAHNSVARNFYPATEFFATRDNGRCYFFTATPKHSLNVSRAGMNNEGVYGKVLEQVPAPELVEKGYILPPKVVVKQLEMAGECVNKHQRDANNLLLTLEEENINKALICSRSTAQIIGLVSHSEFCKELTARGYSWMYITSKTGAFVDGKRVSRGKFFDTLNTWGKDDDKKFVVLHHSILSEGINVSGLEAALFLRNMDFVTISQTIGRVIRKGSAQKTFGLVCVPVYDKVGISTSRRVQAVVDTIFEKGEPAISVVRR